MSVDRNIVDNINGDINMTNVCDLTTDEYIPHTMPSVTIINIKYIIDIIQ